MYAIWRLTSLLTTILNRLVALAVGGALVWDLSHALVGGEFFSAFEWAHSQVAAHVRVALAFGGLLVLLNLNILQFLLFMLINSPGRAYIESKAAGGQSRVSLAAIQDALRATALQVPEISRSRIRVLKLGANRYRVHIRYYARTVHDAGNAAEHLRLVLKKRFSDIVVLDPRDRVEFDLDLAGIDGLNRKPLTEIKHLADLKRNEAPRPRPEPIDPSFKGPIYPVEGEN